MYIFGSQISRVSGANVCVCPNGEGRQGRTTKESKPAATVNVPCTPGRDGATAHIYNCRAGARGVLPATFWHLKRPRTRSIPYFTKRMITEPIISYYGVCTRVAVETRSCTNHPPSKRACDVFEFAMNDCGVFTDGK